MKPNMIKKWSIALLVAAGAAGLTGCEGMRVDEGASNATATNNGNIEDRDALKTNLSGVVVNDFGMPIQGMTVSAYGTQATTGPDGHWTMKDVPVTGVTVNSTPQNLEQTNLATSGAIYVTYEMAGYATYHSRIDNAQAVITHYGTAGGNPNSIVVSNLVASDRVKIPALSNVLRGQLMDKSSLFEGTIGEYASAKSGIQLRLVPEVRAGDNQAGYALYGGSSCQTECGFFGLPEYVTTTDSEGKFKFDDVAKLDGGYVLRVDNYGYKASYRPNNWSGFSYAWDANSGYQSGNTDIYSGNFPDLTVMEGEWEITDDTIGINFDARGADAIDNNIDLGHLFIQDYLVATLNTVEGISVGDRTFNPNDDQGYTSDDGHNALDGATNPAVAAGDVVIDSSIVSGLGETTPLKFIFSGDMRDLEDLSSYANAVIIFDSTGTQYTYDSTKSTLKDRTLTLYTDDVLAEGTYYVRLHRDVFIDMDAKRLLTANDPASQPQFDPNGDPINADDDTLYAEYRIRYTSVDTVTTALDVTQKHIGADATDRQYISAATAAGTDLHVLNTAEGSTNQANRLDIMWNAMRDRYADDVYDDDGDNAVRIDVATVHLGNLGAGFYRLRVTDATSNSAVANPGTTLVAGGTFITAGSANVTTSGLPSSDLQFTVTTAGDTSVELTGVDVGDTVSLVKGNDFGDITSTDPSKTIVLKDDLAPLVALQHSDRNGQDKTNYNFNANQAEHHNIGMMVEFGETLTDEAGEPINGDEKIYYPKLNLTSSLYDECHKRAKSENINDNFDDSQVPVNQTQLDAYYSTTPLLASAKTYTDIGGNSYGPGTCATLSSVGTTCATGRSDRFYNSVDYQCWYGAQTTTTNSCSYYIKDPGLLTAYWETSSNPAGLAAGTYTVDGDLLAVAADETDSEIESYTLISFPAGVTVTADGDPVNPGEYYFGPAGCIATNTVGADVVRNLVIDMTDPVANVNNSDNASALQAAYESSAIGSLGYNNIPAGSTIADDTNGLLHLETPAQHNARSSAYWADTAGNAISTRGSHLIATVGDWRTITETGRWIAKTQNDDIITDTPGVGDEIDVIDSESDGASRLSVLGFLGELDADNTDISIDAGHASGVLLVDATPALATDMVVSENVLTFTFDQNIQNSASAYTENRDFLDVFGDEYLYRVELNNNDTDYPSMIRRGVYEPDFADGTTTLTATEAAGAGDAANPIGFTEGANVAAANYLDGSITTLSGTWQGTLDLDLGAAGVTTASVGDNSLTFVIPGGGAVNPVTGTQTIARGSTFTVATATGNTRVYTVSDTIQNAGNTGAAGRTTFYFTPGLEEVVDDGDVVTFNVSSTHVINANFVVTGAADTFQFTPLLGSDYPSGSTVTVYNALNTTAGDYYDPFGNNGGAAVAAGTEIEVALGGASNELTVTINEDTAASANIAIDFSGYFNDLSHNSATSEDATATSPDLYTDYQMLQDPKFNSWMRVEQYDNYDNGMGPLLVADDQLGPKVRTTSIDTSAGAGIGSDPARTFLYPVSDISITAAHVNANITDDDVIFTPAGGDTTVEDYVSSTNGNTDLVDSAAVTQNAVDDDYPLFIFWGINNSTVAGAVNAYYNAVGGDPAMDAAMSADADAAGLFKLAIKLSGTPTATNARSFIYTPGNADDTVAGGAAATDDLFTVTDELNYAAWTAGGGLDDGEIDVVDDYLLIGMPDYSNAAGLTKEDKLVIDDVTVGGKLYTIIINIPQFSEGNRTNAMSEAVANTANGTFSYQVYRKVSLENTAAIAASNTNVSFADGDITTITSGNAPLDSASNLANTTSFTVSVPFREHLDENTGLSASWSRGTIYAGSTTTTGTVDFTSVTADVTNTAPTANQDNNVDVTLTYNSETAGYIGHGAALTVNTTDFDGNPANVTLTFNLGHGQQLDFNRDDAAVADDADLSIILNTITTTAGSVD